VHSIAGDSAGNLWISHQDQGLFHLLGGVWSNRFPGPGWDGRTCLRLSTPDPCAGRPVAWIFSGWRGVFQGRSGPRIVRSADGLGEGRVDGLQLDRDGTLWAATEGGLSRVKNGRVATLTSKNGLPCDTVHWVMEDDDHSFWLYMACGLVRIARPELDAWATIRSGRSRPRFSTVPTESGAIRH
jgi:ligand-binding sensor domain-containing protein